MGRGGSRRASSLGVRGDQRFSFGAPVSEFWRWSLGDLRMNTARGFLVEFFVAKAVGSTAPMRVEWAEYDVEAPDGTRIEVKASGYLQSWVQRKPSAPSYTFKSAFADSRWDPAAGAYAPVDPEDRVDVWVFALQTCRDHQSYDQLDLEQWEFRVVPHRRLFRSGQRSAGLSFFDRLDVKPVSFDELAETVTAARGEHERLARG